MKTLNFFDLPDEDEIDEEVKTATSIKKNEKKSFAKTKPEPEDVKVFTKNKKTSFADKDNALSEKIKPAVNDKKQISRVVNIASAKGTNKVNSDSHKANETTKTSKKPLLQNETSFWKK